MKSYVSLYFNVKIIISIVLSVIVLSAIVLLAIVMSLIKGICTYQITYNKLTILSTNNVLLILTMVPSNE